MGIRRVKTIEAGRATIPIFSRHALLPPAGWALCGELSLGEGRAGDDRVGDVRFGPKRTSLFAPHMSAFGGKADMTKRKYPLLQSQLGVKRT
jgi:hypothetical protein